MSTAAIPKPVWEQPGKRFSRDEFNRMIEAGIFEGQRYELIDGELINKMGQNPDHAFVITMLMEWLMGLFPPRLVRIQLSAQAGGADHNWSVPEPDVAVLAEWKSDYAHRHPHGDELKLVIEVAGTSIRKDLTRKAEIYATAGVPEYWVIDLERRAIVVHRKPLKGEFRFVERFGEREA